MTDKEKQIYENELKRLSKPTTLRSVTNKIFNQDIDQAVPYLPDEFTDLLIIDPPYNLNKQFGKQSFRKKNISDYAQWFENWFITLLPKLKPNASVYVCCDWTTSTAVHLVLDKYLIVRNRITWEREKGRGARKNWKNASEDIFFATVSKDYTFNVDEVKCKRKVLAPYTDDKGKAKDWQKTDKGNFRLTHPSNLWNDITVPFWSMPENTDHPTQKPEKLIAKLILASTHAGDFVLDPFAGVGTTCVTAKKLNRKFLGIEIDPDFCMLAAKRLEMAKKDKTIQGYTDGVFWERNTLTLQK